MANHHHAREDLARWLSVNAAELEVDASNTTVERLINPTGWLANPSFTVTSGNRRFHAKLTERGGWPQEGLERVYDLRALLHRHRMPRVVAWIETHHYVGVLSQFIEGRHPDESLLAGLIGFADRVHTDSALLSAVRQDGTDIETFADSFEDVWIGRFVSDLDELEADGEMPPFVDDRLRGWMRAEVERVAELGRSPAFQHPAESAIHGDLHLWNVLIDRDSTIWVIDWDDLDVGDPATDIATLLTPFILRGDTDLCASHVEGRDEDFRARYEVCCRAVLLDEIVDTLSDWADANDDPETADQVRDRMRKAHEHGLAEYRKRYWSEP